MICRTSNKVFFVLFLFTGISGSYSLEAQSLSQAKEGILDASEIDFDGNNTIPLSGEWEFYWEKLLAPDDFDSTLSKDYYSFPKLWNEDYEAFGYATYRLRILLPPQHPDLAFSIPDFYSSYELYVNGKQIARNGKVGTNAEEYEPKWISNTVPITSVTDSTVELVLQIANFHHRNGGPKEAILLGSVSTMHLALEKEMAYAYSLTGVVLIGGLFFLGLYFFGKHESAILYFALFCLVFSYRLIGTEYYALHSLVPGLPWILTAKLEYLSLFLSGHFFAIYTLKLYPKEVSKSIIYAISGTSLTFALITVLFPAIVFTVLVEPFLTIMVLSILYASYIYVVATIHKRSGAPFALVSTGVIFLIFFYEMLFYYGIVDKSIFIKFIGYISFFFFQSLVLSYRFTFSLTQALSKAEEASRAKSQFLSAMSHEIRTPLNAVIGLSGLLTNTKLDEKQAEFVNTIKLSGENLLGIINNILDYSKIESGKLELDHSEFNLRMLIENVLDVISSLNDKKELEIMYAMDPEVPEYFIGDSVRIQQVLTNLTGNALKFTEEGEILIRVSVVDQSSNKIRLKFAVIDTGIGIPEDRLDRLFKSFSQVDASTTRKFGGTGLGLAISEKIIDAMDGEISVESEPEKGTSFTFSIKVQKSDRKAEPVNSEVLKGKKVFILDDNPTNLEILTNQLSHLGMKVRKETDPGGILKIIPELNTYDIGVLDLQMPDTDGIEVAHAIRHSWDLQQLPLVLLSSNHEIEDQFDQELFNLYLRKPVKQSQLIANLERVFNTQGRPQKKAAKKEGQENMSQDLKILLVEDNLINQKVGTKILERLGLQADVANNGAEAVEMCSRSAYDLVFMDMEMPVMDGIEATTQLRAMGKELPGNPKIIAMTANALKEDRDKCLEAGMNDFITKPITVDKIRDLLQEWF